LSLARHIFKRFAWVIFLGAWTADGGAAPMAALKEWRGEFFDKKEGGFFVKTLASGFPRSATGNVQVILYGIIQQKMYTFSNTQTAADAAPREIWKLPSGKYRIDRIEFVDGMGQRRVWSGNSKAPLQVLVPRIMLSNLGLWILTPSGPDGLTVKFSMIPNSYAEKNDAESSSVAAVVNGFTGTIQKVIGGKKVIDGASRDYSDDKTLRATSSFTRQIGMFYKVNLFRHNMYARDVSGALAAFDRNLRACYLQALNQDDNLKGDLVLQILASAKTGTIRQAKKSGGSITHGGMIDCMIGELQQIPMPVQENMIGELTFTFETR
jgi:hypothetical protein